MRVDAPPAISTVAKLGPVGCGILVRSCAGNSQNTIVENSRPQAAPPFQQLLRAGRKRQIHPVTGTAFLDSLKGDALQRERATNQRIEIDSPSENVPPQ